MTTSQPEVPAPYALVEAIHQRKAPFDFDAPLPPLNIRTVRPWDAEQTGTK